MTKMTEDDRNTDQLVGIRKMIAEDYADAYALWKKTPDMSLQEQDDSFEAISRLIQFNPDFCFVAERNGQLVGTILGATDGRNGTIYHLVVAKEVQRQGIATKLVNLVVKQLREVGIKKISVMITKRQLTGTAFLQHLKFTKRLDIETYSKII